MSLMEDFYPWVDATGFIHYHKKGHPGHTKPFPDGASHTGRLVSGLILLNQVLHGYRKVFERGIKARINEYGHFIRDPRMVDGEEMSRDAWSNLVFPFKFMGYDYLYDNWRVGWWKDKSKWLFPNHWLNFQIQKHRNIWWPLKLVCELFESINILTSLSSVEGVCHSAERISYSTWDRETFMTRLNCKLLCSLTNVDYAFTEYHTRDISDITPPKGNHPPIHLVWIEVWSKVRKGEL